ncbi:MAG: hypothetical protein Q9220_007124 [cf. Caloplaca sp. 1 TL-2023]
MAGLGIESHTSPDLSSISKDTSPISNPRRTDFLKPDSPRKRRRSPEASSSPLAPPTLPLSNSPKFSVSPPTLTAAQALIDQRKQERLQDVVLHRQTSPNPAQVALGALQGKPMISDLASEHALSRTALSDESMGTISSPGPLPEESRVAMAQIQQRSTSPPDFDQEEGTTTGMVMDSNGVSVASPGRMDETTGNDDDTPSRPDVHRPRRQETDPGEGGPQAQYSFRFWERKSVAVPLVDQETSIRFRRLHDLKRHSKLHTGERPHICPKCHRSFARGDALARHSKGAGGCAGRRSSLGGDEPEAEEGMRGTLAKFWAAQSNSGSNPILGLLYTGEASHEPERMEDDADIVSSRKGSLPSIKRHDVPSQTPIDAQPNYAARQPSTYPPIVGRQPNPGGLYPPMASPGAGSSTSNSPRQGSFSQSSGSAMFQVQSQNVFSQGGGMTESPKPLSPGSHQLGHPEPSIHRNRSPSLTQQYQQQQFARKASMQNTPPSMGLASMPPSGHAGAPHLPSLPGLPPPDLRFTLHSQAGAPPLVHPGQQGSGPSASSPGFQSQSGNNSLSSQSGEGSQNLPGQGSDRLWAYIRSLEVKVDRLQEEVGTLKSQLSAPR